MMALFVYSTCGMVHSFFLCYMEIVSPCLIMCGQFVNLGEAGHLVQSVTASTIYYLLSAYI